MSELTYEKRNEIMDDFGEKVIRDVRDRALSHALHILNSDTVNPIDKERYKDLATLNDQQRQLVDDLISSTVTSTIFNLLDMFDHYSDDLILSYKFEGEEYNLAKVSEKMGSEIVFEDEGGWIPKYSSINKTVL